MVFLAISTSGLRQAIEIAERRELSIWCGADAISEPEYEALEGPAISRFVYSLANEGSAVLAGAIGTIEEHHPGETVWVEHVPREP